MTERATSVESLEAAISALRENGAALNDPARLHFIEAMTRRVKERAAPAAGVILDKAGIALQQYQADLAGHPQTPIETMAPSPPRSALAELTALLDQPAGEASGQSDLEELLRQQERELLQDFSAAGDAAEAAPTAGPAPVELRSARQFRGTLQQLGADRRVARAEDEAHEDAGPLNPQMLVTESLALMRELSPAYLSRFITYFDTLFWLEQAGTE